jgi:hypothetical protein
MEEEEEKEVRTFWVWEGKKRKVGWGDTFDAALTS